MFANTVTEQIGEILGTYVHTIKSAGTLQIIHCAFWIFYIAFCQSFLRIKLKTFVQPLSTYSHVGVDYIEVIAMATILQNIYLSTNRTITL